MKKTNKKGFTIVELVIVIAVIAILSAVLIPTFSNVTTSAKQRAALANARNEYMELLAADDDAQLDPDDKIFYDKENGYFVAIKDGQIIDTVYATLAEAETASGFDAADVDASTVTGFLAAAPVAP